MALHYVIKSPQRRLIWGNYGVLGFEDLKTWRLELAQVGFLDLHKLVVGSWRGSICGSSCKHCNVQSSSQAERSEHSATVHLESSWVLWISKWLWFFDSTAHLHARNFRRQFINHSLLLLLRWLALEIGGRSWSHDQIIEERILKVSILCLAACL